MLLILLIHKLDPSPRVEQVGHEFTYSLLVFLVVWVFLAADALGEPGTGLEQDQVRDGADGGPVVQAIGSPTAPLVQDDPDTLLGEEVGVSAVVPQAGGAEAPIHVGASVSNGDLCRLLILSLGAVEIPLLAVGEEFEEDGGHEDTGEDDVVQLHFLAS